MRRVLSIWWWAFRLTSGRVLFRIGYRYRDWIPDDHASWLHLKVLRWTYTPPKWAEGGDWTYGWLFSKKRDE